MSIALIKNVLLRVLSDPNYAAKGSALTWVQLDTDLKIIADAIIELSSVPSNTSGFEDWNSGETYSTSPPSFVAYSGNIWKYINAVSSSGITPGTDPLCWELQSQGQFSHLQNTDQYLDFGGINEVSASEIRTFIDALPSTDKYWKGIQGSPVTGDIREKMVGTELQLQEYNGASWDVRSSR
jgi:hypothetical protein